MDVTADLSQLERTAFRKFYGDGTFDMYLGGLLAIMPVASALDDRVNSEWQSLLVMLGLFGVLIVGYGLVRHYVTRPRLGTFKPSVPRKRRITWTRVILGLSIVVGLAVMWIMTDTADPAAMRSWLPIAWLLNCVVVFGAMAYFLDVPRFYVYGIVFGSTVMIDEWVHRILGVNLSPFVVFGIPGLGVMAFGAYLFVRFLRTYPAIPAEETSGDTIV